MPYSSIHIMDLPAPRTISVLHRNGTGMDSNTWPTAWLAIGQCAHPAGMLMLAQDRHNDRQLDGQGVSIIPSLQKTTVWSVILHHL